MTNVKIKYVMIVIYHIEKIIIVNINVYYVKSNYKYVYSNDSPVVRRTTSLCSVPRNEVT